MSVEPTTHTLTLPQAIQLALDHNPALERDTQRARGAQSRVGAAGRWDNPTLGAWVEDWAPESAGVDEAKAYVGITQTVPFPGKKSLERDTARAGAEVAESGLRATRFALEREVTVRFLEGLAAQSRLDASRELLEVAQTFADVARRKTEAGNAPAQEQLRAEIELERTRAGVEVVMEELRLAGLQLAELVGWPQASEANLEGALSSEATTETTVDPSTEWLATHPRLAAARAAADQASLIARRTHREPAPDVDVSVAAGRDGLTGEGLIEFGVSLPLPLWSGNRLLTQSAEADAAAAHAELQGVEAALRREWRTSTLRLNTAAAQVTAYRDRILPRSEEALRLVRVGFEEGKFGFLDLLDTQRTATETRKIYIERLLELNTARAELEYLRRAAFANINQEDLTP